jgi:asparagine synthase (glutamine-hydrolysing)
MLIAEDGRIAVSSYREPPGTPLSGVSSDDLAEELGHRFTEAVRRQMMSDVPYGSFLSGGVDSAAIAAAMAHSQDHRPKTFTIGFPGHGEVLDEREAALETALALETEHEATEIVEVDFPAEVARCIKRLEEPCGAPSAPAALELSRFAARSVKVVLSGQGADEPLGGYERHQAAAALGLIEHLPPALAWPVRVAADAVPRNERLKRAAGLLTAPPGVDRLLRVFEITNGRLRSHLTAGSSDEAEAERVALASKILRDVADRDDPLEHALYLDTHLFLPDSLLVYGDKMSMAAGLEQRVPFLDVEFMRFVERVPARLRVRRLKRKWLYRKAVARLVPAATLRRRKHPFATPYDRWLRSSLGQEVARHYETRPELGAVLQPSVVSRLVAEHRSGRFDHKRLLYCLLEFAHWHATFIEARDPVGPPGSGGRQG